MIEILSSAELGRAKDSGALVADILQSVRSRTTVGTNLLDIDTWTRTMIDEAVATTLRGLGCLPAEVAARTSAGDRVRA